MRKYAQLFFFTVCVIGNKNLKYNETIGLALYYFDQKSALSKYHKGLFLKKI